MKGKEIRMTIQLVEDEKDRVMRWRLSKLKDMQETI